MGVLKILDVVIGVVFVFLLVSTICSAIREGLESMLKTRAAYLERGIRELLNDRDGKGLTKTLFDHPLISGLFLGNYEPKALNGSSPSVLASGRNLPSYIPAANFALALLDVALRGSKTDVVSSDPASVPMTVQSIRDRVANLGNPAIQRVLLTALDTSRGDLEAARRSLEDWFNGSMDRISGWYRRSTQWIVLVIALAVTGGMNIDTIAIADYLYRNDAARTAIVEKAQETADNGKPPPPGAGIIDQLALPIGWASPNVPKTDPGWVNHILGIFITALAAMLGTPFWFDVLNRVMVIRSTVKPREKSPDEASEDRQPPQPRVVVAPGAAAGASAPAPVPQRIHAATAPYVPRDAHSDEDCCGVNGAAVGGPETLDEDLPAAVGGVS